jgi:hypothetical protein
VQGEQPCRRVEHVDAAQPRNAQVHATASSLGKKLLNPPPALPTRR